MVARSAFLGKGRRGRPMAFSMPPFAGGMGFAEEGFEVEAVEFVVEGELGAVVEGDGPSQGRRMQRKRLVKLSSTGLGSL